MPAVEEMLCWDSPVQATGRTMFADVGIRGVPAPAGGRVLTLLGAANRDPDTFPDPDRFDVGRDGAPPLAFGAGAPRLPRRCPGPGRGPGGARPPARPVPVIEPAWPDGERSRRREAFLLRGLESLHVRFG